MIAFIHGPDRSLARDAVEAYARGIDPDGANTTWIDARETGFDHIVGAIGAASFFGATRVVVVANFLHRSARTSTPARSSRSESEIAPLLAAVPEQNCLILFEPELASPPAAITAASPSVTIIGGVPPRGPALLAWIADAASRANSRIDRSSAQLLAEMLYPQTWDRKPNNPRYDRPPDMALLSQEIEKLALAAHPDAITQAVIHDLIPGGPDQRMFRFLDAATAGDLANAHGELDRLLNAGEEPAMLLAQLLGQLELLAVASTAHRDPASIARDLGSITPARMTALSSSARRRRLSVVDSLQVGAKVDRNLKTGRLRRPEDALHQLLVAMAATAAPRATGRSR